MKDYLGVVRCPPMELRSRSHNMWVPHDVGPKKGQGYGISGTLFTFIDLRKVEMSI